jgi:hypothetical protein
VITETGIVVLQVIETTEIKILEAEVINQTTTATTEIAIIKIIIIADRDNV